MGDKDTDNERERSEAERYRDLYEGELKLRERLASRLEKASQRANLAQSTLVIFWSNTQDIYCIWLCFVMNFLSIKLTSFINKAMP